MGGKHLFIDEIHKYEGWSVEVKQIYDSYSDLQLVISGSSIHHQGHGRPQPSCAHIRDARALF